MKRIKGELLALLLLCVKLSRLLTSCKNRRLSESFLQIWHVSPPRQRADYGDFPHLFCPTKVKPNINTVWQQRGSIKLEYGQRDIVVISLIATYSNQLRWPGCLELHCHVSFLLLLQRWTTWGRGLWIARCFRTSWGGRLRRGMSSTATSSEGQPQNASSKLELPGLSGVTVKRFFCSL